jgi:hypothetical protein
MEPLLAGKPALVGRLSEHPVDCLDMEAIRNDLGKTVGEEVGKDVCVHL